MISHENGLIFIHVPYNGGSILEELYLKKGNPFISSTDTKKLARGEILTGRTLAKTIKQFYDYDLFSLVKSPYLRAFEMWRDNHQTIKKTKYKKLTIGEYFENILNKKDEFKDLYKSTQKSHLVADGYFYGEQNLNFEVNNLFSYEDMIKSNLDSINEFLSSNDAPLVGFYIDSDYDDSWRDNYDKNSIDIINYVFEEDFQYCGYQKI